MTTDPRAIALVDGEHYPSVIRAALAELPYDVVAAVLVGGTEKLRSGSPELGVPLVESLEQALQTYGPELVVDLSDEPVLSPPARLALVGRALALGVPVEGPDFRFEPPVFHPVKVPSLAVIGTGKRVGKTAVTGMVVRTLARALRVVVVAMGRGGPEQPELVEVAPTVESLLALSRLGRHAASDHLELAALAGVPTVGCRRCGGGLAGAPGVSNVLEGAQLALSLDPDLVLFDGSGAALPPVAADRRVLVVGAHQDRAVSTGYLNGYRALISDAILVTMAELPGSAELASTLGEVARPGTPVLRTMLRPAPHESVAGERVAYFGTAPDAAHAGIAAHLRDRFDARVAHVSGALADRRRLAEELALLDVETFVVEVKAAAVDVVLETADQRGVRVVLAANDVIPLDGGPDLVELVERLGHELVGAQRMALR